MVLSIIKFLEDREKLLKENIQYLLKNPFFFSKYVLSCFDWVDVRLIPNFLLSLFRKASLKDKLIGGLFQRLSLLNG